MPLSAGDRLGPYEITGELGAGGMGIVLRARDTKLDRDVALKVLPEAFTSDPDRLTRFEREANVLASLNHPNIGSIYGLEEAPSTSAPATGDDINRSQSAGQAIKALVLELVEGPTLADRIAQGPIPLDEALPIARQIAEALEAAHEAGVIHRDLKPANIKVREDGTVKVLDFGLAKVLEGDAGSDPSESPTMTAAATRTGVLMGTAAYMSPEQAKGKVVDKRTDVWAFGCVLYEILTGQRAFAGENVSETVAAVLTADVDLDALPADVPPARRRLLRRCLERDPKKRLRDIADGLFDLDEDLAGEPAIRAMASPLVSAPPWLWVAATALVVGAGLAVWNLRPPPPLVPLIRDSLAITLPAELSLPGSSHFAALSPDGRHLVFVGERDGATQLYHRPLDQLDAIPIPDTDGALAPFFSPDGESVGFTVGDGSAVGEDRLGVTTVKRVSLAGGPPTTVFTFPVGRRWVDLKPDWSDDDTIWFGGGRGLYQVSALGGTPEQVTTPGELDAGVVILQHPRALPGGRAILHSARTGGSSSSVVAVYELDTGRHTTVVADGSHPWFTSSGHVVFSRGDRLWALSFDVDRLVPMGEPVLVREGVRSGRRGGLGDQNYNLQALVGNDGTLVYVPSGGSADARMLVWVDERGNEEPVAARPRPYANPKLTPDGTRVAVEIDTDIWVHDLAAGRQTQITTDPGQDTWPLWTQDSRAIIFASDRNRDDGGLDLFRTTADGLGEAQLIYSDPDKSFFPASWLADGRALVVTQDLTGVTSFDIGTLPMQGQIEWSPLLQTPAPEYLPAISPNGGLLAYTSHRPGPRSVSLRPLPDVTARSWPVSPGSLTDPVWSVDGRKLYYRDRDQRTMMVVPVDSEMSEPVGVSEVLFEDSYYYADMTFNYTLDPDTGRFLMIKDPNLESPREIIVVRNWIEELKERVPTQ